MSVARLIRLNVVAPPVYPSSWPVLAAGQSGNLTDTGLVEDAVDAIQWNNRFYFDNDRGKAYLLGKKASSQGGAYFTMLYDVASNSWTYGQPALSELGHVYESVAYEGGTIYTGVWASRVIKSIALESSLTTFTNPATGQYTENFSDSVQPALAWHPNLFGAGDGGLVIVAGRSNPGKLVAWRKATNTFTNIPSTPCTVTANVPSYTGAAVYCRGGDYVLAGSMTSVGGKIYKIPAGSSGSLGAAVQVADPPVDLTYPNTSLCGALLDDPTGAASMYVLEKAGTGRVWKWDGAMWNSKGYTHPFPNVLASNSFWVAAPCYPHGVFMCRSDSLARATQLWKPND